MSDDYELKTEEIDLVKELARRVIAKAEDIARCPPEDDANGAIDDCIESERRITSLSGGSDMPHRPFHERCDGVSWGGIIDDDTTRWWPRKSITDPATEFKGSLLSLAAATNPPSIGNLGVVTAKEEEKGKTEQLIRVRKRCRSFQ